MYNRRTETRMLCADLVDVHWKDKGGRTKRAVANLEDISGSGACVQGDLPIPLQTGGKISLPHGALPGTGRHCGYRRSAIFWEWNSNRGIAGRFGHFVRSISLTLEG